MHAAARDCDGGRSAASYLQLRRHMRYGRGDVDLWTSVTQGGRCEPGIGVGKVHHANARRMPHFVVREQQQSAVAAAAREDAALYVTRDKISGAQQTWSGAQVCRHAFVHTVNIITRL